MIFSDNCQQNGFKNAPMAPRPHLGCPHEGSRLGAPNHRVYTWVARLATSQGLIDLPVRFTAQRGTRYAPSTPNPNPKPQTLNSKPHTLAPRNLKRETRIPNTKHYEEEFTVRFCPASSPASSIIITDEWHSTEQL